MATDDETAAVEAEAARMAREGRPCSCERCVGEREAMRATAERILALPDLPPDARAAAERILGYAVTGGS